MGDYTVEFLENLDGVNEDDKVNWEALPNGSGFVKNTLTNKLKEFRNSNVMLIKKLATSQSEANESKTSNESLKNELLSFKEIVENNKPVPTEESSTNKNSSLSHNQDIENILKRTQAQAAFTKEQLESSENENKRLQSIKERYEKQELQQRLDTALTSEIKKYSRCADDSVDLLKNTLEKFWYFNEQGELETKDAQGVVLGKKGDPITVKEWLDNKYGETHTIFKKNTGAQASGNFSPNNPQSRLSTSVGSSDFLKSMESVASSDFGNM